MVGLDLAGAKGLGRTRLEEVPGWLHAALVDPSTPAAERERLVGALRAALVGEGAWTTAGARVLGAVLDLLGGLDPGPAPALAGLLALDLAWGEAPPTARGRAPFPRKGAGAEVRAALAARVEGLRGALGRPSADAQAAAALLLAALGEAPEDLLAGGAEASRAARWFAAGSLAPTPALRTAAEAALLPPSPPDVQVCAAAAALAWGGAPPLAVVQAARLRARSPATFPLPVRPGASAVAHLLDDAAFAIAADVILGEVDAALAVRATNAALGDLHLLLARHAPAPADPTAAPPVAQAIWVRTAHETFAAAPRFEAFGLLKSVGARRRWLGLPSAAAGLSPDDPLAVLIAWEEGYLELPPAPPVPWEAARAAWSALPPARRAGWARAHLERRARYPGAASAPNGVPARLALDALDDAELERRWLADPEPFLAALASPDPGALLARLPKWRRLAAFDAWLALHPNRTVALRQAEALLPAVPFAEAGRRLAALLVESGAAPTAASGVLAASGEAGAAARAALEAALAAVGAAR